jgi:superfamily II DNA or RNA helicase
MGGDTTDTDGAGPQDDGPSVAQDEQVRLEADRGELVRRIEELERENAELRSLAGLATTRPEPVEAGPAEPRLFPLHSVPQVDATSKMSDKIALLRRLFQGRPDVYAVRWENVRSGESGYAPAVEGGWGRVRRGGEKAYLPLTDEVLAAHLRGETAIGVFPLLEGDVCYFLACDFDGPTSPLDALAFHEAAARHGIVAPVERSRSGDGAHVWIFFAAPVPAASARRLGACLLREAMATRAELDLASYDRFFPSQDLLPKGGFGNLIALPLQGRAASEGNAVFVDPISLEPHEDQWAFLSDVPLVDTDTVESLARELDPPATWRELASGTSPPTGARPAPERVDAQLRTGVSVDKSGLPPWLLRDIKHLASIHNPEFYKKQRMRFSTHDTPRFIGCYHEDLTHLHIPRGLREDLADLLEDHGATLTVSDDRPTHAPADLAFTGELSPLQEDAAETIARDDLGVLVAPPGLGKTVIACSIAAEREVPTLVLVTRTHLVEQWRTAARELLAIHDTAIGQIGGGRDRPVGRFDIAMLQTLARRTEALDELLAPYGHVIADECHHIPARTFADVIERAPARYVLGLTATPYRNDGLDGIIAMQCGPTRYEIATGETPAARQLDFELTIHETDFDLDTDPDTPNHEIFAALVDDTARTEMICRDVAEAAARGRRCLVLTERKDHLHALADRLKALGNEPAVLIGGIGKKARQRVIDQAASLETGEGFVIVATGRYIGEGFDCPPLDTLFLTFPVSFRGIVVQYTGRLLRTTADKEVVRVHDYADTNVPMLARMLDKRVRAHRKLGFEQRKGGRR